MWWKVAEKTVSYLPIRFSPIARCVNRFWRHDIFTIAYMWLECRIESKEVTKLLLFFPGLRDACKNDAYSKQFACGLSNNCLTFTLSTERPGGLSQQRRENSELLNCVIYKADSALATIDIQNGKRKTRRIVTTKARKLWTFKLRNI